MLAFYKYAVYSNCTRREMLLAVITSPRPDKKPNAMLLFWYHLSVLKPRHIYRKNYRKTCARTNWHLLQIIENRKFHCYSKYVEFT